MKYYLHTFLLLLNIAALSQNKPVGFKFIGDALVGDNSRQFYKGQAKDYFDFPNVPLNLSSGITIVRHNELDTNARTIYDLQSNGVCNYIQQDPNNPKNIHAVFMVDKTGASGYPDRRTKYFFSNDTGNTWQYLGDVPNVRSGFPSLGIIKNTATQWLPIIVNHSTAGANTGVRTQAFVDIAPGIGGFVTLDPGGTGDPADQPIWPYVAGTTENTSPIKFNFIASKNAGDTMWRNRGTSISTSTFAGYTPMLQFANANSYSIARDGNKVCIAGVNSDFFPADAGDIWFMESTDGGINFSTPIKIWDCNFATDSIGGLRSIDAIYYNGNPRVFMGLCKVTETGFFPNLPSSQRLWGPDINGGVPVIVDSRPGLYASNPNNFTFTSCCKGVIGKSINNSLLYAAWNIARSDSSAEGNNYYDIYFSISSNGGLTWITPVQITNISGPLRDCRFASISDLNNFVSNGNHRYVHIVYELDSIAGSSISGAPVSFSKMMFMKLDVSKIGGITPINNEIPNNYSLKQNYPNPFNPNTKIRFDIKAGKSGLKARVKLVVYDVLGREVTQLVNEQLQAGKYEVNFDAEGLQSGVYFYKLVTDGFTESKKMIVLK